ncbi:hypothetical protein GPALN_014884 [Globodera pallida]|nr:hypothetical protein GPALN_014884 [Globodera pallida]
MFSIANFFLPILFSILYFVTQNMAMDNAELLMKLTNSSRNRQKPAHQMSKEDKELLALSQKIGADPLDYILKTNSNHQNEPSKAQQSTHVSKGLLKNIVQMAIDPKKSKGTTESSNASSSQITAELDGKIDQIIKTFVQNSNKNRIQHEGIAQALFKNRNIEKLSLQMSAHLKPLHLNQIDQKYDNRARSVNNFIRIVDAANFGIGISMFLLEIPGQFEMENWRTQIQWIACKLLHIEPIYDQLVVYTDRFIQRLIARGGKNSENVNNMKPFLMNFENANAEMISTKSNLNIYLYLYQEFDKNCKAFYGDQFLNSDPTFHYSIQILQSFLHETIQLFVQFIQYGSQVGVEQLKKEQCQF